MDLNFEEQFKGICKHVCENTKAWERMLRKGNLLHEELPGDFNERIPVKSFERMLLNKVFCPHRIGFQSSQFVQDSMGKFFIEDPPFVMKTIYDESDNATPIVFVLSAGSDPGAAL